MATKTRTVAAAKTATAPVVTEEVKSAVSEEVKASKAGRKPMSDAEKAEAAKRREEASAINWGAMAFEAEPVAYTQVRHEDVEATTPQFVKDAFKASNERNTVPADEKNPEATPTSAPVFLKLAFPSAIIADEFGKLIRKYAAAHDRSVRLGKSAPGSIVYAVRPARKRDEAKARPAEAKAE